MLLTSNEEVVTQYLDAMTTMIGNRRNHHPEVENWVHSSTQHFIRDTGEFLSNQPLTAIEWGYVARLILNAQRFYRTRECYQNAGKLMMATLVFPPPEGITVEYGEGIGYSGLIPCDHAVLVVNGKPIDLTWREDVRKGNRTDDIFKLEKRVSFNIEHNCYYMVRFPVDYALRHMVETSTYGVIEMNRELVEKGRAAYAAIG